MKRLTMLAALALGLALAANAQERKNYFEDPFVQVTRALPLISDEILLTIEAEFLLKE